jgi:hypothetical protein
MAKRKQEDPPFPRELMGDVQWSFTGEAYPSLEEFIEAVREYHGEIRGDDAWRPDEVVLRCRRVRVEHEFSWDEEDEARVELTADDPRGFTAGELLFKVHNAFVHQLRDGDHVFFEGFSLLEEQGANAPPLYDIDLGR